MQGCLRVEQQAGVARVVLSHPGKFNAMSRGMWRELRTVFERLQKSPDVRCVVIGGESGNFCAGGDISEYTAFRFQEPALRNFHENEVWGGLQAMLDCDVPLVAEIEGNCMGAGLELASCCDIRLASDSARFGAPIAKLGFPMAPREARLVGREVGLRTARRMLLEAAVFSAADMQACGFLSQVMAPTELAPQTQATALGIAALAPQAARMNKQTLRALMAQGAFVDRHAEPSVNLLENAYAYADSAEHREGIQAFLEKRKPVF